ncbi:Cyclin Y [Geranomyces michiganensis]|nr:Cyclin Y [Geranomyces michiganensis]
MGNTTSDTSSYESRGSESQHQPSHRSSASPSGCQKPIQYSPGSKRGPMQARTMPRLGGDWQQEDSDEQRLRKPGSESNLAWKPVGAGEVFDPWHRVIESRVVPDDENLHAQPAAPPQPRTQPALAAAGGYRTGGALVRGSRLGSAFDIDVEKGPGTPIPAEGDAGEKARKGSWVDKVTGMMDGLYLAAESVVKDTVRDWEAPPPPPPLSKMEDQLHFGSRSSMTDSEVTHARNDIGGTGVSYRPTADPQSAGSSGTLRSAVPPSAVPSSPPKDIGDGLLARRAYNTATVATAPTTATPPLPPPSQLPIGELKKVATAAAPGSTRLEAQITHSTTSLDDGDEAKAPKLSRITKYNSCSTLFVEATISSSDLTDTLHCVSRALVRHLNAPPLPTPSPDILSEEKHPLSNHIRFYRRKPREDDVFRFLECLFNAAELTAECGIITLIYVERLLNNTRLSILPANWVRIVLGALLLAAKVWDDHAVWNVDFVQIFPDVQVIDM